VSTDKRIDIIKPEIGGTIPGTARDFVREHQFHSENDNKTIAVKENQYILYWTQEGNRVWNDNDEQNATAGGFFFETAFQRKAESVASTGRLVVLIGTTSKNSFQKEETLKLAKLIADQLYIICPWAGPPQPSER
jgi:hypothetical protein